MELRQYLKILRKYLWMILLVCAIGAGSSFYYSSSQPPIYKSTTTLALNLSAPGMVIPYFVQPETVQNLVPTYIERCYWGQGDGSTLGVVPTHLGRIGGLICFEHAMPLARYALIAQGEQVHVAAWPGYGGLADIMEFSLRHHAFEAQAFVVSACGYLDRESVSTGFPLRTHLPDGVDGGSQIINPQGEVIAGPLRGAEGILTAEIDLREVVKAKAWLDGAGHYARAEVLQLTVNPQAIQTWHGTVVEEVRPLVSAAV